MHDTFHLIRRIYVPSLLWGLAAFPITQRHILEIQKLIKKMFRLLVAPTRFAGNLQLWWATSGSFPQAFYTRCPREAPFALLVAEFKALNAFVHSNRGALLKSLLAWRSSSWLRSHGPRGRPTRVRPGRRSVYFDELVGLYNDNIGPGTYHDFWPRPE